jgi:hypothetical protein
MTKQPAIIFDRDGTLFSVKHHMNNGEPQCWHCYNGLVAWDAPVPLIRALFHSIRPGVTKIITSGRMEQTRYAMLAAMSKHDVVPDLLLMRRDKDQRKDSVVKTEIYREKIEPFFDVRFVVDDRPQVVQAWKDLGLPVMSVTDPGVLPRIVTQGLAVNSEKRYCPMYAITVQIEHTTSGGYTTSVGIPTFYLDENVQGFTDEDGAVRIAAKIIDPIGYLDDHDDILHITAVKL